MKNLASLLLLLCLQPVYAQTDSDGLRMSRNSFCGGVTYTYSTWDHYWEGLSLRTNENMGTVSSSTISVMGAYGVVDRLNIIFMLPYIKTNASGGTLKGQQGLQDLSLFLKLLALNKNVGSSNFQAYAVLGGSVPSSKYIPDFLPLSIGVRSSTVNFRVIGDYQIRDFFATASGIYTHRSNIHIDKTAYYTTRMIYSDEVYMPDTFSSKLGLGYRKGELIIEAVVDYMNTLGGFDIRKNDMPFPANKMGMTRTGLNLKIPVDNTGRLSLVGNSFYTLDGRNAGQTLSGTIGVFYIFF